MAQLTVSKIVGEVIATSRDGVLRTLKLGDKIQEGETVVTKNGATVVLTDELGSPLSVAEKQTISVTQELFTQEIPTRAESVVVAGTSEAVIEALNRGQDLSTELEATAAGLAGGTGADGGSSFVQLLRIVEGVDPLSYEYSYVDPDPLPDLIGTGADLTLVEEDAPVVPPPVVEPPAIPPTVVVTKEYRTEVTTDVKTETAVGDEYETGRNITTDVTTESKDNGVLTTTTVTTVITYNKETNTITTTTTTTTTYVRDVTTTTLTDGTETVVTGEWTVFDVDTDVQTDSVISNTPREETLTDVDTDFVLDPVEPGDGNNGHGNNTDGQDDDNPGQGGGGPNEEPKDGDDEDEGDQGNQGDDTPGVGQNDPVIPSEPPVVEPEDPIPPLLPPEEPPVPPAEDNNPGNSGQNNGWGNGDQTAPGESGPVNNAENSDATNPLTKDTGKPEKESKLNADDLLDIPVDNQNHDSTYLGLLFDLQIKPTTFEST